MEFVPLKKTIVEADFHVELFPAGIVRNIEHLLAEADWHVVVRNSENPNFHLLGLVLGNLRVFFLVENTLFLEDLADRSFQLACLDIESLV